MSKNQLLHLISNPLAPELKFVIITPLQADNPYGGQGAQPAETLAALSLVCRSWQGPAQSSLF